jgi:rRNA maturation RNase YbeY
MMVKLDLQVTVFLDFPVDREGLVAAMEARLNQPDLAHRRFSQDLVSVSLAVVDEMEMERLNWTYHQTKGVTDVLSFPFTDADSLPDEASGFVTPSEAGEVLGDIAVCYEVTVREAENEGKTVDEMIQFYVLHGLEHLLGHHHD